MQINITVNVGPEEKPKVKVEKKQDPRLRIMPPLRKPKTNILDLVGIKEV